ncbi:hypothetical protein B566_EDAN005273 [Ephemera danica]|nr:hypothetical protein B566_EDAN005273 [Ephemera danica]
MRVGDLAGACHSDRIDSNPVSTLQVVPRYGPAHLVDRLYVPEAVGSGAVSSQVLADPNVMCRRTRRLRPRLADTCRREPGLVRELAKGAQLGTRECQFQFRNRRWNCTTARRSLRRVLLSVKTIDLRHLRPNG